MFFVVSKLLSIFLQPLFWLLVMLIWARFTRKEGRRPRLVSLALGFTLLVTNPFLANVAYQIWEVPPVAVESVGGTAPYEVAIVLGGFSSARAELSDRLNFGDSANRLTQALELYHQGKVKKILITGGSAAIVGEKLSEGEAVVRYLERIKFPLEDVIIERKARNTFENATLSAELLTERNLSSVRCLLLTDGFHMRRAVACFEKAGVKVDPFSTSSVEPAFKNLSPNKLIVPSPEGFVRWQKLVKEMVGFVVYRVMGKG